MNLIARILAWLGCDRFDIGRDGDTYLTRWTLLGKRFDGKWRVFLHCFHRGDIDPYLHNHPWPFISVILSGGYWEWTPTPLDEVPAYGTQIAHWYGPGRILRRPATWRHRVDVPAGRRCWSLVFVGNKVQSWGFFCPRGFVPWRDGEANLDAGMNICGESAADLADR